MRADQIVIFYPEGISVVRKIPQPFSTVHSWSMDGDLETVEDDDQLGLLFVLALERTVERDEPGLRCGPLRRFSYFVVECQKKNPSRGPYRFMGGSKVLNESAVFARLSVRVVDSK
jgi:hypothetical protein